MLLESLQEMVDQENLYYHGVFDPNKLITIQKKQSYVEPDSIVVKTQDTEYAVTKEEYRAALHRCRDNLFFSQQTNLPIVGVIKPKMTLMPLGRFPVDVAESMQMQFKLVPNEAHYDLDTQMLTYLGTKVHVTDPEFYTSLNNGHKLAVAVRGTELVWISSYEFQAHLEYQYYEKLYDIQVEAVHELMQKAKTYPLVTIPETSILKKIDLNLFGANKVNYSGLSANSHRPNKRNSVNHLAFAQKPIHEYPSAELLCQNSEALCGSQKGAHYGLIPHHDLNFEALTLEDSGITCKTCLSKLNTLLKKHD